MTDTPVTIGEVDHNSPDYRATVALRDRILRAPLGLAFSREELAAESAQSHLAATDSGGRILACLVLRPDGASSFHMRQLAVTEPARNRGLGKKLVHAAETHARARGATLLYCHARESVVPFYEKLGYHAVGDLFEEVTLPHLRMEKGL